MAGFTLKRFGKIYPATFRSINRIIDPGLGLETRISAMNALGRSLGRWLNKDHELLNAMENKPGSVLVVSAAEDADYLVRPFLSTFIAPSNLRYSCLWLHNVELHNGTKPDNSVVLRRYDEPTLEQLSYLIIMRSVVVQKQFLRTMILDVAGHKKIENVYVMSPIVYLQTLDNVDSLVKEVGVLREIKAHRFAENTSNLSDLGLEEVVEEEFYSHFNIKIDSGKLSHTPELILERVPLRRQMMMQ